MQVEEVVAENERLRSELQRTLEGRALVAVVAEGAERGGGGAATELMREEADLLRQVRVAGWGAEGGGMGDWDRAKGWGRDRGQSWGHWGRDRKRRQGQKAGTKVAQERRRARSGGSEWEDAKHRDSGHGCKKH